MTNHLAGGPPAKLFVWFHRQQKCSKVRDSTPHTPFRSSMERRWGSNLTVFVAPPTVAGAVPWWLLFLSSACLWCPRSSTASSRRARAPHANLPSVRELRIGLRVLVVTLQRVVVQNPQPACTAEADRAEATVAPLRDLHGRGERFEEVKMERRVAPGEGTVASLPPGRSPANAVTRSSWFRWRPYS